MAAQIVTLVNQKGGVGKDHHRGQPRCRSRPTAPRVLLVDLDPQANATSAVGVDGAELLGIYDAILDQTPIEQCIVAVPEEGLSLVPANRELSGAEVELVPAMARERRLVNALDPIRDRFEWVLIDCPPSLGLLTINAMTASDSVIIPVQCEYMALEGLSRLVETLDLVRRNLNPSLAVLGVALTMFDGRTRLAQQVVDEVRSHFDQTFQHRHPRARCGSARPRAMGSPYSGTNQAAVPPRPMRHLPLNC